MGYDRMVGCWPIWDLAFSTASAMVSLMRAQLSMLEGIDWRQRERTWVSQLSV